MTSKQTASRSWLAGYRWNRWLAADALAGLAVAALLIPESLGLAVVAGLPPEVGLFAAPLALLGYALFGGSRIAVIAVASAVSAISASVVGAIAGGDAGTFIALSAWLAIVSGLVYVTVGLLKMGWIANFMSEAVITGFVMGLAVYIIAGQLDGLVGVEVEGENAIQKIIDAFRQIPDWEPLVVVIGVGALALLFLLHRFLPKIPGALVVVALGMAMVAIFDLGSRGVGVVGELPTGLPSIGLPDADLNTVLLLIPGALAVTLVGFSEGFAAVRAYAEGRVDVDRELIGFGVANLGAGLSSGMVVGGSLSKTATSDSAGGKTQMANLICAVIIVAALLFIGPIFAYLPEAVLAAVVIHAVWGLIKVEKLRELREIHRFDFYMAVMVFLGTLLLEPIYAVLLGVAVSLVYIVYRVSFPYRASLGVDDDTRRTVDLATHPSARAVPGLIIYRMDAPLLYPNANAFQDGLRGFLAEAATPVRGVIIDCEAMFTLDSTGVEALRETVAELAESGVSVRLARVRSGAVEIMGKAGVLETVGDELVVDRVEEAIRELGG
ncbi:MAG: SulP family inorganic anion transporter [Acidimicrobiia bacterium]